MNYQQIDQVIKTTNDELDELNARIVALSKTRDELIRLRNNAVVTPEEAQPGDKLEDGCIVIERYPKTIFYNERLLIAAPQETEVLCEWTPEFKPVFDKLKEHGLNPSDWFIPSVEQLQLAYKNASSPFPGWWYWSSDEASSTNACYVYFNNGTRIAGSKAVTSCVRAFRLVEL
jgi:hypothetical protein